LTVSELALCLDEPDEHGKRSAIPAGAVGIGSYEEMMERARFWRSMSPERRLKELARRGR